MPTDVIEKVHDLQAEEDKLLAMHIAAIRVLDSTIGGGWGSFRVDGLSEAQVQQLPGYIEGFVGQRLPRLFYDEDGQVQQSGGMLVRPEHSKFTYQFSIQDDESGELRHWFKWDKELYDYDAFVAAEKAQATHDRRQKIGKYVWRGVLAALISVDAISFGMTFKGLHDAVELQNQNAPQEEIRKAGELSNYGMVIASVTSSIVAIGASTGLAREVIKQNKKVSSPTLIIKNAEA